MWWRPLSPVDWFGRVDVGVWEEIHQQPAVLADIFDNNHKSVDSVGQWLAQQDFSYVVIAARGTSDNAARYAQYLWGTRNRLPVALAAPSLFGPGQSPPRLDDALVVGISQSGESPDLLAVLQESRRQHRPTLAITNNRDSPMAASADQGLELGAGEERAVAATKTFTAQLMAVAMLSMAMARDEEMAEQLDRIPSKVGDVLQQANKIATAAEAMSDIDRCAVLGRGYHQATAFEWALKLQELCYLVANPYSTADFRHGPIALVEAGFPILAVLTAGVHFLEVADLLKEVQGLGAEVVAVSNREDVAADHVIEIPGDLPEWLDPITAVVAVQLFTFHLAQAKGIDPDQPRGLRKVTRTT